MGRYKKGEHVKVEVVNEGTGEIELMWLFVEYSDNAQRIVFGVVDSEPIVNTDLKLGQHLAVSYDNIRDRRRFR